jgi:hypothetical protein
VFGPYFTATVYRQCNYHDLEIDGYFNLAMRETNRSRLTTLRSTERQPTNSGNPGSPKQLYLHCPFFLKDPHSKASAWA